MLRKFPFVSMVIEFLREFAIIFLILLIAYIAYVLVDFQDMIEANTKEIKLCIRRKELDDWIIDNVDELERIEEADFHGKLSDPMTFTERAAQKSRQ